jgi:hypothetical protein
MHPSHRLEDKMPLVVNWVKGFEGCPCGPEVAALAASHIQDDVTLMTDLSTANELVCGKGIPIDDFSNVISSMKRTVEKHVENPIREIKKREGHAVIVATRNDVTKEWSRSYFPLI